MRLIESVEIAYFRSCYKVVFYDLRDLTIFFGRNDSGKSNIIRALNLFFNGETNPQKAFDFTVDFNNKRASDADASEGVRKFIYVKITFSTPRSFRKSLGESFYVKRQWSISRGSDYHQEISSAIPPERHQYVTRLLNQISFHYIPAVKDRGIFSFLLKEIYNIVSTSDQFAIALDRFSTDINEGTSSLFSEIESDLGFRSAIAAPRDLADLFSALDIETSTAEGQSLSLTLQRGDGLQARHIPELLRYISDKSTVPYHIWGFEEPENSLEMAASFDEAERFERFADSNNKQIFVTSHSPAFFSRQADHVKKYFVERISGETSCREMPNDMFDKSVELMGDTFLLAAISESVSKSRDDIRRLNESVHLLKAEIASSSRPVLYVEGQSDKAILNAAYMSIYGVAPDFAIEACGGTVKMQALSAEGEAFSVAVNNRKIFCLVDNDFEGRKICPLKSAKNAWSRHSNGVYWMMLPVPQAFRRLWDRYGIHHDVTCFCIEDCFDVEVRRRAENDGKYNRVRYKLNPFPSVSHAKIISASMQEGGDELRFAIMSPDSERKKAFSEFIRDEGDVDCSYFEPLFSSLREIMAAE